MRYLFRRARRATNKPRLAWLRGLCVAVSALVLGGFVATAGETARSRGNNTDYCDELAARRESPGSEVAERVDAALLACRLKTNLGAAEIVRMLGPNTAALEVQGDNVLFVARASAPAVSVAGTITAPMERITGTDLWAARFRIASIERALLKFMAIDSATWQMLPGTKAIDWRGPRAALAPLAKSKLTGRIVKRQLWSDALQETRKVNVYLPPGFSVERRYPALYMGDGDFIFGWAAVIEPLIDSGAIVPIVIVAAEAGQPGIVEDRSTLGVDVRSADYLPDFHNAGDRFERHMRFFTQELLPYAEREFALTPDRTKRAIQGQSNSAVFARWAGYEHPELFGAVLAFSHGWSAKGNRPAPGDPRRASFVFSAGLYEAGFYVSTKRTAAILRADGYDVTEEYAFAGHDPTAWSMMLVKYLPRAFAR